MYKGVYFAHPQSFKNAFGTEDVKMKLLRETSLKNHTPCLQNSAGLTHLEQVQGHQFKPLCFPQNAGLSVAQNKGSSCKTRVC